jgi:spectinomycin phosphotransferase
MLEKPALADEVIIACVQEAFGLTVEQLAFLPLGADLNTAVYRLDTDAPAAWFLKLRSGNFNELSLKLPQCLRQQGIAEIIAPLPTRIGALWVSLAHLKGMLYPFIAGHDAYDVPLSEAQWRIFGRALARVHTAVLPAALRAQIPLETYSPKWRKIVEKFMQRVGRDHFTDPVASEMASFLHAKQNEVSRLLQHTEALARIVQAQQQENVVCHSDIHAWNLLISSEGALYIVDWDDPILAPKERDLMFIGAGIGNIWNTPREETLFYEGYGQTHIQWDTMAYYRCERIIQDIAVYCEQIFLSDAGGPDRAAALRQLMANFLPKGTLELALNTSLARD